VKVLLVGLVVLAVFWIVTGFVLDTVHDKRKRPYERMKKPEWLAYGASVRRER
jgi:tryptophan-rich sensory protein